jgi:hypothetical protein
MTKLPLSGASSASTLVSDTLKALPPAKFITSEDSEGSETMPLSLVYALNIIEVTRVSMGLAQRDSRSDTASIKSSC